MAKPDEHDYDYIVVGSGVAAAVIVSRLLRAQPDLAILVLEAGPRVPLKDRRRWWDYVVTGRRPYQHTEDRPGDNVSEGSVPWGFPESRLMIYGGTTVHWGGWSFRFKPEDFRLKEHTGRGADWPIPYKDLTRCYGEAEHLLGVCGDAQVEGKGWRKEHPYPLEPFPYTAADGRMIEAFQALKMSYAPLPMARHRKCMTTGTCKYCPVGARFSASYAWDALLGEEPKCEGFELRSSHYTGLRLRTQSPVSRLFIDNKTQVRGVEYVTFPGEGQGCDPKRRDYGSHVATARRIVLAAGAIETPKLLQRSRHPLWPNGLGNDYDLVGRYVITHPFLLVRGRLPDNPSRWQQEMDFPTLMSRHYDTEDYQRAPEGKLLLFKSRSRPRVKLAEAMRRGSPRKVLDELTRGPMEFELQGFIEEFSNFHNRIENGPGLNQFGLPQTRVGFSRNPDFDSRTRTHLGRMRTVIERMGCKHVKSEVRSLRGDHASATCRMAESPEEGVVDPNLRVHGVENLYVCSNAVFPSGAVVNPTLTLTALAIRLGDELAGAHADPEEAP